MPCQIALLRGINVGGRNLVAMSDLRALMEALGFAGAKTLLQSGNLVFQSGRQTSSALERLLEVETQRRLGASVSYLLRSADEWGKIIARNPFPKQAEADPSHLLLMCMREAPDASAIQALKAAICGPETLHADRKQLYLL